LEGGARSNEGVLKRSNKAFVGEKEGRPPRYEVVWGEGEAMGDSTRGEGEEKGEE